MKFEEKRCGYLSSEFAKMRTIRDSASNKESEIFEMVRQSSLAKELSEIFNDLSLNGESNIEVNNWLKLNLLIRPLECKVECLPFHSLLFKDSPKRLEMHIVDKNLNGVLNILIKRCKYPVVSIKEISEETGVPYKTICNGALHFIRWNRAKPIPCVTSNSAFVNHSGFVYTTILVKEWERTFKQKEEEFVKILALFSTPKKIKEISLTFAGKNKIFAVITWLLRKNVIVDLHYHLYLLVRPMPKTKYFEGGNEIIQKFNDSSNFFKILERIFIYCTGSNMIEEILESSGENFENICECVSHYKNDLKMVLQ